MLVSGQLVVEYYWFVSVWGLGMAKGQKCFIRSSVVMKGL